MLEHILAQRAGVLAPEQSEKIDHHLELCAVCASEAERFLTELEEWDDPAQLPRLTQLSQRLFDGLEHATDTAFNPVTGPRTECSLALLDSTVSLVDRLYQVGAIDYGCDFILPNGFHADTHFNVGAICASEQALQMVTAELRRSLDGVSFDTVVSTGWAMASIARRLIQGLHRSGSRIKHVRVEGYSDLSALREVERGSESLLLLDIIATGNLAKRAAEALKRRGSVVVRALVMVDPAPADLPGSLEALCTLPVQLNREADCPRCQQVPRWEYNPVACHLTERKNAPLSLSRFLNENPNAVEFWELVSTAQAYEHHHVEGRRHYRAYVDTLRLVSYPSTGPTIVSRFCSAIADAATEPPSVLVTRNRASAVKFANAVAAECQTRSGIKASVVVARTRGHCMSLSDSDAERIQSQRVLIVDTAAAHGDTIDELDILIRERGAANVAAGVILSRLGEARESAFASRLTGGFFRLYSFPVPPVEIHSGRLGCQVCAQREAISFAARTTQVPQLQELVVHAKRFGRRTRPLPRAVQLDVPMMMQEAPLLERCKRAVAAGVALHALHASMGNGMAPVVLPEIHDSRVPIASRTAILEDLPAATLKKWSGDALFQDLANRLPEVSDPTLWAATAGFLERGGSSAWLGDLRPMIHRASAELSPQNKFWNQLAYVAFRASQSEPERRSEIRSEFRGKITEFGN
jgi:orotate phosphoribosyltransferase